MCRPVGHNIDHIDSDGDDIRTISSNTSNNVCRNFGVRVNPLVICCIDRTGSSLVGRTIRRINGCCVCPVSRDCACRGFYGSQLGET